MRTSLRTKKVSAEQRNEGKKRFLGWQARKVSGQVTGSSPVKMVWYYGAAIFGTGAFAL